MTGGARAALRLVGGARAVYICRVMPRVFVAQTALDRWMGAGGVFFDADMLRFGAAPSVNFYLQPAVHFISIEGGGEDPYDILGAVKTGHELAQMGADHYDSSAIIGDAVYTVSPGFVGTPVGADGNEAQLEGGSWSAVVHAAETLGYT